MEQRVYKVELMADFDIKMMLVHTMKAKLVIVVVAVVDLQMMKLIDYKMRRTG